MIARLLPFFASLLASTLRVTWEGESITPKSVVAFWHGKMFAGWWSQRRSKPVALVSKSSDGALLAGVLRTWRYRLVRGSSSSNGREALEEAIAQVKGGEAQVLVITPDGPRGPYHEFKRGAFLASYGLACPLYFVSVRYNKAHTFQRSWDKFELPYPFSRVTMSVKRIDCSEWPLDPVKQKEWMENLQHSLQR